MKRENRYFIIKIKDAMEALTVEEREKLAELGAKVEIHRSDIGKQPLEAVVVESDWPEYEKVWGMIEERCK